jgi:hypothetical protein
VTSIYDEIVHGSVESLSNIGVPTTVRSHPGAVQIATRTAEDQPDDGYAHSGPWFAIDAAEALVELLNEAIERATRGELTKAADAYGEDEEGDESEELEAHSISPGVLPIKYPDNWVVVNLPGGLVVAGLPGVVAELAGFGKS